MRMLSGGEVVANVPRMDGLSYRAAEPFLRVTRRGIYFNQGAGLLLEQAAEERGQPSATHALPFVRRLQGAIFVGLSPCMPDVSGAVRIRYESPGGKAGTVQQLGRFLRSAGLDMKPHVNYILAAELVQDATCGVSVAGNWTAAEERAQRVRKENSTEQERTSSDKK